MRPGIQIVTAPSILGLKPTGVEHLPESLLSNDIFGKIVSQNHVVEVPTLNRLYSVDRGSNSILNEEALRDFSLTLSETINKLYSTKDFILVLGGDCSILIGIMLALRSKGAHGLFFLDAHADFYEPERSPTGEAADMDLALVTGRGPDSLTNINGLAPYVKDNHVVHLGQRDGEEARHHNSRDIRDSEIICFDASFVHVNGIEATSSAIRKSLMPNGLEGFWIHFDTDVIEDSTNPAVDYRLPGGLSLSECEALLKDLIARYNVLGMTVTIFNPSLDPAAKVSGKLAKLLCNVLC